MIHLRLDTSLNESGLIRVKLETIQLATGDTFMSDNEIAKEEVGEGIFCWVGLVGTLTNVPEGRIGTE